MHKFSSQSSLNILIQLIKTYFCGKINTELSVGMWDILSSVLLDLVNYCVKCKQTLFERGSVTINTGKDTRFWIKSLENLLEFILYRTFMTILVAIHQYLDFVCNTRNTKFFFFMLINWAPFCSYIHQQCYTNIYLGLTYFKCSPNNSICQLDKINDVQEPSKCFNTNTNSSRIFNQIIQNLLSPIGMSNDFPHIFIIFFLFTLPINLLRINSTIRSCNAWKPIQTFGMPLIFLNKFNFIFDVLPNSII